MRIFIPNPELYLSIDQFEKLHRSQVIHWLIQQKSYPEKDAERLSVLILNDLKKECCPKKPYRMSVIWQIIHKFTQRELVKAKPSMGKNFGLTETTFNTLLEELQEGNEVLFEKVFISHFEDCMTYLKRNYNASAEDAYDASMESMLEFMKRMKAGKITYGNLRFLFTQMAGQIYLKWIKKEQKKTQLDDFDLGNAPERFDEETMAILNKAWEGLCGDCKHLLQKFYYDGMALKSLAEILNKPAATVRKQKQRCVEKLRGLFAQHA